MKVSMIGHFLFTTLKGSFHAFGALTTSNCLKVENELDFKKFLCPNCWSMALAMSKSWVGLAYCTRYLSLIQGLHHNALYICFFINLPVNFKLRYAVISALSTDTHRIHCLYHSGCSGCTGSLFLKTVALLVDRFHLNVRFQRDSTTTWKSNRWMTQSLKTLN